MKAINPATEELIRDYPELDEAAAVARLEQADRAFASWRRLPVADRAGLLRRAAELLNQRRERYGVLMSEEMGKPVAQAEAEIDKCARCCEHYADNGVALLEPEQVSTEAARSYVRHDPLGVVLAIMPWNFPFWQVFRFAAPTLLAGNVAAVKHAPNVPGCALAIEELFREAGFPEGVLTALLVPVRSAPPLIVHSAVRAVTLTGSDRAGEAVAAQAGKELKKVVLELGGSDPFIVLADADLEEVVGQAVKARTQNTGQSCIAAKRFLVEGPVADRFTRALTERMAALRVGDPRDRATELGPLARLDLLENLHDQVRRSLDAGAECLTGGERLPGKGFFYAPTVLSLVEPGMPAFDEETFGPVAAVIPARDADHAVELANRSRYGLGASIWTGDVARGERLAGEIEAGAVFVNNIVASDPRLPFGGVKRSGFGRELSHYGVREFLNVKTVWVR